MADGEVVMVQGLPVCMLVYLVYLSNKRMVADIPTRPSLVGWLIGVVGDELIT
jgi:hypothetical protein